MKRLSWARFFIPHLLRSRADLAASVAADVADIMLGTKKDPRRAASFSYRIFDWNDNYGYEYALVSALCPGQAFGETWPLVTADADPRDRLIDLLTACITTDYSIHIGSTERNLNLNDTVVDIECPPSDRLQRNKHLASIFEVCKDGSVGTIRESLFADPASAPIPARRPAFSSPAFWVCTGLLLLAGLYILLMQVAAHRVNSLRALVAASTLEQALISYHAEYGHLPNSAAPAMLSTGPGAAALLNTLNGKNVGGDNPRQAVALTIETAKRGKGGIVYDGTTDTITGLYDPWGRPYHLYLDTTASGSVRLPSGETVPGKLAVIISDGPDGKPGTRDDVRSDKPAPKP